MGPARRPLRSVSGRLVAGAVATLALVAAGCGGDDDEGAADGIDAEPGITSMPLDPTTSTPGPGTPGAESDTTAPPTEGPVDAFGAVAIAAREGPGTVVDLDRDDGRWEVEVRLEDGSGVELHLDMATGAVIQRSGESTAEPPPIGIEQAMTAAMEAAPGGEVTQADLDDDDGRRVWDVEIDRGPDDDDEVDVEVDAVTGAVLSVDDDRDDD